MYEGAFGPFFVAATQRGLRAPLFALYPHVPRQRRKSYDPRLGERILGNVAAHESCVLGPRRPHRRLGVASAQERFGALTGRVTDQQGGAIPGVIVITTHADRRDPLVRDRCERPISRADLTPGRYTVRFELIGFAKVERTDVLVQAGRTIEVNTQLNVGN